MKMDMPIPTPSPYSDDSEGSVLRDFVNETIAHEQHSPSPRSELLSQTSHSGRDDIVDPGPSKRSRQRSYKRTKKPHHELVNSDASPDELLRLLMEQKKESHTLKRALRLAAVRVDAEAQRVLAMERVQSQTTEHFRRLNEGRVAAQQDAMKANSELRLYQFQFEHAQKEIARAQEMLRMVEDQRDEAEEAAARAKEKARKYLLDRTVAAAREEARREGFEMGLRQVQEEEGLYAAQRRTRQRPNITTRKRRLEHDERGPTRVNEPATNHDVLGDTFDQMSHISSPTHRPPRDLHNGSPQVIRVEQPTEPVLFSHPEYVPPDAETYADDSPPPPEPLPITHPVPDLSRPHTPSIQIYSLEIPPAAELERQDSQIYPGRDPQPWLTAQQHEEMTSHQASQKIFQSNAGNVDIQIGGATFIQTAPQVYPGKRKESWYRTLSRRLSRKRKPDPQNGIPAPAQPGSWYTPTAKPAPPVIVRDYAMPKPQSMADSASVSTRMSQLDIVSPPNMTPNGSERSLRAGIRGRRKFTDKDSALFVINEDPASRVATPVTGDVPRGSMNLGQPQLPRPSSRPPTDADSSYSNPKAVDEWRRSSASFQRDMSSHVRPPSGLKRPVNLTIAAPLSSENARVPTTPRSRTMSNNTQNSSFVRAKDSIQRLDLPGTPSELSPIGITVVPPSRSPSEALGSARPQDLYLSPNQAKAPSLHSVPSIPVMQNSSAHGSAGPMANGNARGPSLHTRHSSNQRSPLVPQQGRSRPGSTASHGQTQPYPMAASSSKSPSWTPQPLPSDRDRPPSQHWPGERTQRNSLSHNTPKPTNQILPRHRGNGNADDNISLLSSSHSANDNAPRQSYHNLPSTNGHWGGTARSDGSHRRGVSDSHLTPGPSHTDLPHVNGGQTLHRVSSNLSMRSAGSQYAKYDESKYLDPAYYPPEAVNPNKGKGVDRRSLNNSIQRPPSAASSATLSYITDPMS
ncbi:hypothetical protein D9615_009179 [Tricholomella constricta]|uniref:Uncharacterized protein n=1 Tax=Tricholomella constricta TaxID=117010 RepID=A0A8H5H2K0_9AGAR|nr:hypothetical protein D9615_009179 [Tricholomella constricta]